MEKQKKAGVSERNACKVMTSTTSRDSLIVRQQCGCIICCIEMLHVLRFCEIYFWNIVHHFEHHHQYQTR